jgi:DNA mismatch repair protein MSH3
MGGKSVLMRQAALLVIMAQLGSWVPAASCVLSVFDGVYTRMGASDCLKLGRSTFAEELGEASHILARATSRWVTGGNLLQCIITAVVPMLFLVPL